MSYKLGFSKFVRNLVFTSLVFPLLAFSYEPVVTLPSSIKLMDCDTSETQCYRQQLKEIKNAQTRTLIKYANDQKARGEIPAMPTAGDLDILANPKEKSDTILVLLHGLWGDGSQFDQQIGKVNDDGGVEWKASVTKRLSDRWVPHISVVLPGHGIDSKNEGQVTFQMWLKEVEATTRLAKKLGKKVVLVGQSTGGLLAYAMGVLHPELVDGLVLVEPALKVKGYLRFGTCGLGPIFKNSASLRGLAKVLGRSYLTENDHSLSIGCEVVKLGEYLTKQAPKTEAEACTFCGDEDSLVHVSSSDISDTFSMLTVPTLLLNNEDDDIVDPQKNKQLAEQNPNVSYAKINDELPHGIYIPVDSITPFLISKSLMKRDSDEVSNQRFVVNKVKDYRFHFRNFMIDFFSGDSKIKKLAALTKLELDSIWANGAVGNLCNSSRCESVRSELKQLGEKLGALEFKIATSPGGPKHDEGDLKQEMYNIFLRLTRDLDSIVSESELRLESELGRIPRSTMLIEF